jgi:hypothetical protein
LSDDDPQTVSYPITVILDRMDLKLDKIDSKLDTKADRSDLLRVEEKVDAQDARITALETAEAARQAGGGIVRAQAQSRQASLSLIISAIAALGAVGAVIATIIMSGH